MRKKLVQRDTNSLPLQMVCSTKFGRYPKISKEQVWNMFESDGFMVPYAGHKLVLSISQNGKGRGAETSERGGFAIIIIDERVYAVDKYLNYRFIASLQTSSGTVFIAENDAGQIGICDKLYIYIYDYVNNTFSTITTDFSPGSLAFQDGYFIAAVRGQAKWRLSTLNNGTSWPADAPNVGLLQAPDNVQHCVPMPNIQGQLFVFGSTVVHCFNDLGQGPPNLPYARNNSFSIDYGCINPATIAAGEKFIVWLGSNNKSGLAIMYSTGGPEQQISTDGINLKLEQLTNPQNSYGSLVKIDGHLFYQLTFFDPADNFTLTFDFNTQKFYFASDHNQNYHQAQKIFRFNNKYYFVSNSDGNLYEMSSNYFTYEGDEVPRIIITPSMRKPDTAPFIGQGLSFVIEQGEPQELPYQDPLVLKGNISLSSDFPTLLSVRSGDEYNITNAVADNDPTKTNTGQMFNICKIVWNGSGWDVVEQLSPRVDLSLSRDGGQTFGGISAQWLNNVGYRQNMLNYWDLGLANELIVQARFYGFGRFVISDGEINIR